MHTLLPAAACVPAAQGASAVAPDAHAWPAEHSVHSACDVRLVAALQLPAAQGSATLAPSVQ